MYFYELHEGDGDLFIDVLLIHDVEFDEESFLELVLEARRAVVDTFKEDTLVEAVANELERRHGFTFVHDARLTASVDVSREEGSTALAELDDDEGDDEEEDLDDDLDEASAGGFRTVVVEADRSVDLN